MGPRAARLRRSVHVARVARCRTSSTLRELGVVGSRPATPKGAVAFREALEELRTTFIKLGQLLSSHPDLLPDVYIEELEQLVDQVPPVPFDRSKRDRTRTFRTIPSSDRAGAAGDGLDRAGPRSAARERRRVIVKVRRPGIVRHVEVDLELLRRTAGMLERRSEAAQLLQARALAEALEVHLRDELNLSQEAHNTELIGDCSPTSTVSRRPAGDPAIRHRGACSSSSCSTAARSQTTTSLSPKRAGELARQLFRFSMRQITIEGVYHADPHRGNVLLLDDGRLALLDLGLLGRLDDGTRRTLSLLLLAVGQNRAERRRRVDPQPLADNDGLRRAGLRARAAPQAPALPLAPAVRHPRRRGSRRSPTILRSTTARVAHDAGRRRCCRGSRTALRTPDSSTASEDGSRAPVL